METHYHSQFDNDDFYDEAVYRLHHELFTLLILALDETAVVPLDFTPVLERILAGGSEITAKVEETQEQIAAITKKLIQVTEEAQEKAKQSYEETAAINTRYYALLAEGNMQEAEQLFAENREREKQLLVKFKQEQDHFVRIDWYGEVFFPHEILWKNIGLLQPTRGKVDIGANKIALMAQESYKFNITIRENIIFSKEKNRDSLILNTMQKLTALSIVGRLENGLDTRIGASLYDDGIDLSGGETQKIVATRTLLDNADIWIFDEPVAAMDPSSEYSFFNTVLEEDDKSKTMIFVSHRLKIASKMNRIIYLENGKIVGIGTHQQLMTGCEKYRRYYVSWLLMEND